MESSNYKISVIVPVYNVEQYLKRCVDSILAQTENRLEIILVDDGSTDCSGAICDAYASQYEQIRVCHKENGGLTSAWKAGLALAIGEYTGFVDSDDWIDPDMYERMLALAEREEADVTVCGLVFDFEDPKIPKREEISNFRKAVYEPEELEESFPDPYQRRLFLWTDSAGRPGNEAVPDGNPADGNCEVLRRPCGGGRGSADYLPGASGYPEAVRGAGFLSLSLLDQPEVYHRPV